MKMRYNILYHIAKNHNDISQNQTINLTINGISWLVKKSFLSFIIDIFV